MFIICRLNPSGTIHGTPSKLHDDYDSAKAEAERLAGVEPMAHAFMVFKAFSKTEREKSPVKTTVL